MRLVWSSRWVFLSLSVCALVVAGCGGGLVHSPPEESVAKCKQDFEVCSQRSDQMLAEAAPAYEDVVPLLQAMCDAQRSTACI